MVDFTGRSSGSLIGAVLIVVVACMSGPAAAQFIRKHEPGKLRGFHASGAIGGITRSFKSDAEARKEFEGILSALGLNWISDRIALRASAEIDNAAAGIAPDGSRFIFYNAEFMQKVRQKTADHWSLVSILAHEVGHHLAFHNEIKGRFHEFELEADYFSGFVLRRLGATLDQASAAMREISPKQATKTHPSLADRVQAITIGWTDGGGSGPPRGLKNPNAQVASNDEGRARGTTDVSRRDVGRAQPQKGQDAAVSSSDPDVRMRGVLATNNATRINREIDGFLGANKSEIRGIGLRAYFIRHPRISLTMKLPGWLQKDMARAERTGNWRDIKAGSLVKLYQDTGGVLTFEHDVKDLDDDKARIWSIYNRRDDFYAGDLTFSRVGLSFRTRLAVGPRAVCSFRLGMRDRLLSGNVTCTRPSGAPPFAIFQAEMKLD